jgi:hypothetical protein
MRFRPSLPSLTRLKSAPFAGLTEVILVVPERRLGVAASASRIARPRRRA